jgi:hypothetical protein
MDGVILIALSTKCWVQIPQRSNQRFSNFHASTNANVTLFERRASSGGPSHRGSCVAFTALSQPEAEGQCLEMEEKGFERKPSARWYDYYYKAHTHTAILAAGNTVITPAAAGWNERAMAAGREREKSCCASFCPPVCARISQKRCRCLFSRRN